MAAAASRTRRAPGDVGHGLGEDGRTALVRRKFYGPARLRAVRDVERSAEYREYLEGLLRLQQGLKLRRKTEVGSLWDPGDELGVVRRTLDFSGDRTLLKARLVELRVEGLGEEMRGQPHGRPLQPAR